jgi:hypothetical protein
VIFRATQKVSSKLRIACTAITDGDLSMVEWYCNLITVRRRQFFLFTHAPSLFSFWAPAAGSTRDHFGQMFRRCATETLRDYGFSREMNDIANESPMQKIGMENPAEYLRQVLRAEKPHNIALHRAGARVARSGR